MKKLRILTLALLLPAFVTTGCDKGGDEGKPTYTVTFAADGGTPVPAVQKVTEGEKATVPAAMTKTGYTFLHWSRDGVAAYDFATPVTANFTLTAKWEVVADPEIEIPDESELTQEAFADDETTGGFTFTAKSAWTATVTETSATRASNVPWLRLLFDGEETYSGAAGSFTLVIELDENYSGKTRTATIAIKSGDDTITITVTQDGKTETGVVPQLPRLITSITNTAEMNSGRGFYETDSYEFKYYENDFRLKEFRVIDGDYIDSYTYDYSTLNEVAITAEYDVWTAALNSKGYASTIGDVSEYGDGYTLTYDANDYLVKVARYEYSYWDYVWNNGNLVDHIADYGHPDDTPPHFTTELNDKTNIDWNVFFTELRDGGPGYSSLTPVNLLALIDKAGKRSRNYIVPVLSEPSGMASKERHYTGETEPEAGAVVGIGYDVENSGEPFYSFDSEGCPTTYTWKESVVKSEWIYTGERVYVYPSDEQERRDWEQRFGPGPWFDLVTTTKTYPAVIDTYRWNITYNRN